MLFIYDVKSCVQLKKMKKTNWIYTTMIVFAIAFIISWLLLKSWKISLISATISGAIIYTLNPVRRYIKAFWSVLALLVTLNSFALKIILKLVNTSSTGQLEFETGSSSIILNVSLVALCIILLVLDFFERNGVPIFFKKIKSDMNIKNNKKITKQINMKNNKGKIEM